MLLLLFVDFFNKLLPCGPSMMDTLYKRSAYKRPGNNFVRETTEMHQFKLYLVFMSFPWIQLLRLLPGPASQCRKKEIRDDGLCSHLRLPTYRPCCVLHTTVYARGQPWAHCLKLFQIVLKECVLDFLYWINTQSGQVDCGVSNSEVTKLP